MGAISVKTGPDWLIPYIVAAEHAVAKEKRRLFAGVFTQNTSLYGVRGALGAVVPAGAGLVPKSTVGAVSDPGAAS